MKLIKLLLLHIAISFALTSPSFAQLATPNANGLTYGHVHLNVSDMDLHKQIWTEFFDGVVVQKGFLTAVRMPNMLVALSDAAPTTGSRDTVMDHFGFKVRNIRDFLTRWEAAGYEAGEIFTGAEGQDNAYVMLPDNVRVELQEDQALHVEIAGYHVHFYTPEAEELLDWYADIFGLEIRPRGSIATTTNTPGMNLSFATTDTPRAPTQGTAIDHIGFEFEDLEAFCRELEARGIEFDIPFREIPAIELKIAFITDPSGVRIELTEGYDDY